MVQATKRGSAFLFRSIHPDLATKSNCFNTENCGFHEIQQHSTLAFTQESFALSDQQKMIVEPDQTLTGRCLCVRESPSHLQNQLCFVPGISSRSNSLVRCW